MAGIEPVYPAWEAGALTIVLHPHAQLVYNGAGGNVKIQKLYTNIAFCVTICITVYQIIIIVGYKKCVIKLKQQE